jgi:hypothetical protein
VFIRAIQNQDEIQRLYEESQARRGDEIAYERRREVDWSSRFATRGIEASHNGKFSGNGGILGEDFNWVKSIRKAWSNRFIPSRLNEENITSRMNAETGIAFIPWSNGQVIRGHGRGVLVKFDGFRYLHAGSSKNFTVMPVI